jgi:hypothetical protein
MKYNKIKLCALVPYTVVILKHKEILKMSFFSRNSTYVYIYFTKEYNFKNFRKDAPNMVLSNEPLET